MRLMAWLGAALGMLMARAVMDPTDVLAGRKLHEATYDWGPYPEGTATTWTTPRGLYFARKGKARWKHARRLRG